jgi:hypothetical protein
MSKTQDKKLQRALEREEYIIKTKAERAKEAWEEAQIKAAGFQSVLDYAIDQFNQHKEELEAEMVTKTEEMIETRQKEIETFLMSEKDKYLESIGIQAD